MGRRRRKVIKIPKKNIPKYFLCPECGTNTVTVVINEEQMQAKLKCGNCTLMGEVSITKIDQPIDIYCKFIDKHQKK